MEKEKLRELVNGLVGQYPYLAIITRVSGIPGTECDTPPYKDFCIGLELMKGAGEETSLRYSSDKAAELLRQYDSVTDFEKDLVGRLVVPIYGDYCCDARPVDMLLLDRSLSCGV